MTSLRTRIIITYVGLAVFCVGVVSLSANLLLKSRFVAFMRERIEADEAQIVKSLSDAQTDHGPLNEDELTVVGMNALERGLIIAVSDHLGQTLWDAQTHNGGMCQDMILHMSKNLDVSFPGLTGQLKQTTFSLRPAGTVTISYYGPFFPTDAEVDFLNALNRLLLIVAFGAAGAAVAFGFVMAGWLSAPLQKITAAAHRLRVAAFDTRIEERSSIREIADLSQSINGLAQSLDDQARLRQRLSSDVSHELRTPLSSLQGNLEAMIDGVLPADQQRLSSCLQEIHRLTRLVGRIEHLAQAEAHLTPVNKEPLALGPFIEALCTSEETQFTRSQIDFRWSADDVTIQTDSDKLSQIIVNLLSNAAKYTQAGGSVRLEARTREDQLSVVVEDSGIGIPADDLPHIFERLYRVDDSRSRQTGGDGIGLTIAKAQAEQLGGVIQVTSQLGKGSVFAVRLPN